MRGLLQRRLCVRRRGRRSQARAPAPRAAPGVALTQRPERCLEKLPGVGGAVDDLQDFIDAAGP
jgi:hypothetical protein